MKVLVVDDDLIVCELLRERLQSAGHEVVVRDQALGTSRWILEHAPDVVLLDVMMPALSGVELAALLRRRGLDTKIVFHSSKSKEELEALVESSGALGFIRKGAGEQAFLRAFEKLVAPPTRRQRKAI